MAASEKDEKQIKEYSSSPVPVLRFCLHVAVTCQPSDSDSAVDVTSAGDSAGCHMIDACRAAS